MTRFEVQCVIGEERVCIEVPSDRSVGDVMRKVSEVTGKTGVSIWSSEVQLECESLFADYFEPEATYVIKLANDFPEGSLMLPSSDKLEGFGVDLTNAKLLMEVKGRFDMEEFVTKVVEPGVNPTLFMLEWQPGFVAGGFAGVPWPKNETSVRHPHYAADPEKKSFIFSLEPKARRFDLLQAGKALRRAAGSSTRIIMFGDDLIVCDDGCCARAFDFYAGGREDGSFPDSTGHVRFTRFELWAL
jgi:hypothetical protein